MAERRVAPKVRGNKERFCTESSLPVCHCWTAPSKGNCLLLSLLSRLCTQEEHLKSSNRGPFMPFMFHRLLVGVRSSRAFVSAEMRKLLRLERHDGDFASQRVCPFCGLITPRYESCCLECGKVLKRA